jgi:hypothetical protein
MYSNFTLALYNKSKKMTKEKLIENAKALKADISLEYENKIGIRYKNKFTWHWFEIWCGNTENEFIDFCHSYSQNTGSSKKGVTHKMKVCARLGFYENL